eukprot:gene58283-biopygen79267
MPDNRIAQLHLLRNLKPFDWERILGDGAYMGAGPHFLAPFPDIPIGSSAAEWGSIVAHYRGRVEHSFARLWRHRLFRDVYLGHDVKWACRLIEVACHLDNVRNCMRRWWYPEHPLRPHPGWVHRPMNWALDRPAGRPALGERVITTYV